MRGLCRLCDFSVLILFIANLDLYDASSNHEKSKYLKESQWLHYSEIVEKAVANYEECSNQNCDCFSSVLTHDLRVWKEKGEITQEDVQAALQYGVHYQVINHKLYREDSCMFPFRCRGVEHFLLQLVPELSDMELVINVKDWPQASRRQKSIPIFSFSKVAAHSWDIMYPAWTFWEGGPAVWPIYPTGLGRWDLQRNIIARKALETPWDKKKNQAFFRGSRTSADRDPLILLSRKEPDLVDAQYTKNQAWKSNEDTLHRPPAEEVKLEDHCQFRYLFNFRGVAASFRLKHLFLCGSTVFHVGSEWLEFFYPALKPWVHYIPVSPDLSDARQLLMFARDNQEVVKNIAERGRRFITDHLRLEDVSCYWRRLLQEYSSLLNYKPKKNKAYKQIKPQK